MANTGTDSRVFEEKLSPSLRRLWARFYPGHYPCRFRELLFQHIHANDHVLEIGAGSGRGNQNHVAMRGRVARYIGIDPAASVLTNPYLDEAHQCKADSLPFADGSFDLVFHCFVAEHFESPLSATGKSRELSNPVGSCSFRHQAATTTRCWPLR
jgi:SAM-dependent methyltransferase